MTEDQFIDVKNIMVDVEVELNKAFAKHPSNSSLHHGFGVLAEEVYELWLEVIKQSPDREKMRKEAIQVGAMAVRFILDAIDKES